MTAEVIKTNTVAKNSKPTHTLRKSFGYGKHAHFETVGVAWDRNDGSFYIKLYGTQLIEGGFYAFPTKEQTEQTEGGQ